MTEKLHYLHIALLIYMIQLDITIFSYIHVVTDKIGTNGWAAVIILSLIALCNILFFYLVYRMGKGRSYFDILEGSIPKWVLSPFYLISAVFWICLGSFIVKNYVLLYQMYSLQNTNSIILYSFIAIMVYYLLSKGIYNIGKAATLFFIFTFWLFFLFLYFLPEWKLVRFTPYFFRGGEPFSWLNWAELFTIFLGYELCLFLFPYVNKQSKLFKGVVLGHLLISFVQIFAVLLVSGFFSFRQLQNTSYPMLDLAAYLEMPFIYRLEVPIFAIFLFSNLISGVMYSFAALSTLERVLPKVKTKVLALGVALIFFFVGFIPKILRQVENLLINTFMIEMLFAFIIPFVLLLLLWIQSRKARKKGNA